MSYNCDLCHRHFKGSPAVIPTKIRHIIYPHKIKYSPENTCDDLEEFVNKLGGDWRRETPVAKNLVTVSPRIGIEYVESMTCCPFCAAEARPPLVVETVERDLDGEKAFLRAGK